MTDGEFNELLNRSLVHPFPIFHRARLASALRHVVKATGPAGEEALRDHCRQLDEQEDARLMEHAAERAVWDGGAS